MASAMLLLWEMVGEDTRVDTSNLACRRFLINALGVTGNRLHTTCPDAIQMLPYAGSNHSQMPKMPCGWPADLAITLCLSWQDLRRTHVEHPSLTMIFVAGGA